MSDVVQFKKTARRRWTPVAPKPLVFEIMDALHDMGGQAHRDLVFNYIAANRANAGNRPSHDFFDELLAALRKIVREEKMSAIIVEQSARKILPLTDRAIILERGAIAYEGASADLAQDADTLARLLGVAEKTAA